MDNLDFFFIRQRIKSQSVSYFPSHSASETVAFAQKKKKKRNKSKTCFFLRQVQILSIQERYPPLKQLRLHMIYGKNSYFVILKGSLEAQKINKPGRIIRCVPQVIQAQIAVFGGFSFMLMDGHTDTYGWTHKRTDPVIESLIRQGCQDNGFVKKELHFFFMTWIQLKFWNP